MSSEPQRFATFEKEGRVATITFNRPESRNAIGTAQDCADILEAMQRASDDAEISCIILTGAGTAFSAGGNLRAMKERRGIGRLDSPANTRSNYKRGVQQVIKALWDCEIPMIAAINGHAIGLGLDLASICDIRIASEKAKFASSFIKMGLIPGDGGTWILPRAVGLSKASEMILTGNTYDAAQMLQAGLISTAVAPDQLMNEARAMGANIVCNPAKSLRMAKRLLREGQQQRLADVLELASAMQAIAHETEDSIEAVEAFLEKRNPNFTGQ